MQRSKLDAATNTVRFSCFGVRIVVEFDSLIPNSEIRSILPPGSNEFETGEAEHSFSLLPASGAGEETEPIYFVRNRSNRAIGANCLADAVTALRKKIHLCVAEHAPGRVFIHAGVAAWNGRAIVCPGRSYAGKSTLIWSMLNAGATYYSDEYAVFDNNGLVHPFSLPINLRGPERPARTTVLERVGIDQIAVSLILFTQYRKHGKWNPALLTPGETVLQLMKNSISMRRNPSEVLKVLTKVSLTTKAYAGSRSEADRVLDWLRAIGV